MKAALKLEIIGDNVITRARIYRDLCNEIVPGIGDAVFGKKKMYSGPWVAEVVGWNPLYRFERRFLKGIKDYSEANGIGSRGVVKWFTLDENCIYEVSHKTSWRHRERYFCRVNSVGEIEKMREEEVSACLKRNASAIPS